MVISGISNKPPIRIKHFVLHSDLFMKLCIIKNFRSETLITLTHRGLNKMVAIQICSVTLNWLFISHNTGNTYIKYYYFRSSRGFTYALNWTVPPRIVIGAYIIVFKCKRHEQCMNLINNNRVYSSSLCVCVLSPCTHNNCTGFSHFGKCKLCTINIIISAFYGTSRNSQDFNEGSCSRLVQFAY